MDGRIDAAINAVGARTSQVLVFDIRDDGVRPGAAPSGATRSANGEPAMVLKVPALQANVAHAVLHTDESGYSRWIFPATVEHQGATRGAGGSVVFHLPQESVSNVDDLEDATRGIIIKAGRRLVRVVSWLTDPLIGQAALSVARTWENKNRPYDLHMWPGTEKITSWDHLRGGRTLMFIHGTFSNALGGFGALPEATYAELQQRYNGRVVAFNHPSLHQSPQENIDYLLQWLPDDLELDLVTHSRGGLVGRHLAWRLEQQRAGGGQQAVKRAVLVAAPNRGTPLADGDHWYEMLDRYTNLAAELPDHAFTLIMEGILMVVKLIGHAMLDTLPGLNIMNPNGEILKQINQQHAQETDFYAMVASYMPKSQGWIKQAIRQAGDKLVDHFFGEANDGVVPTEGGFQITKDGTGWSIPTYRYYDVSSGINHSSFFKDPAVSQQLLEWLAPVQ